jgi:hypothetical protein
LLVAEVDSPAASQKSFPLPAAPPSLNVPALPFVSLTTEVMMAEA